jgi:Ca-activated chloride channel family protein
MSLKSPAFKSLLFPLLLTGFASPAQAQSLPQLDIRAPRVTAESFRSPDLRVDVDLVLLPVVVTNRAGAVVNGLKSSSFTVLEDNAPKPIVSFGSEDVPCSVGVVVDISGSMAGKTGIAAGAMRAFFETANPQDEAFLLTVSTRPDTLSGFTSDFGNLESQLSLARPGGSTALVDTIQLALNRLRGAHNPRRALLIISDGMDNHSRYSEAGLLRLAQEADVQIYTIGMEPSVANKKAIELTEERNGLAFLSHLSDRSGGLNFTMATYENPVPTASKIGTAIRNQYLIGYHPADGEPGKWHAVRVKVDVPQVHVSARNGYYTLPATR